MSITTIGNIVELECDVCGAILEFEEFEEALSFKKDKNNGWISKKINEDWHDICDECKDHFKNGGRDGKI